MKFRHLGRSLLQVITLGLGTTSFGHRMDAEQSARLLHEALDLGVNFIDTADTYANGRSEELKGGCSTTETRKETIDLGT